MKQFIKSYNMFFPDRKFGIILYMVYPVITWIVLFLINLFYNNSFILLLSAGIIIIGAEGFADHFVFGGFGRYESNRFGFLETSAKFTSLYKRALITDAVRRFLSILFIITIMAAVLKIPYNITFFIIISIYLFSVITVCITRFFDNILIYYNFVFVIEILFIILVAAIYRFAETAGLIIMLLDILLPVLHFKFMVRKYEEVYYDKEY